MANQLRPFMDNPYIPGVELWPHEEEMPLRLLADDGSMLSLEQIRANRAMEQRLLESPLATEGGRLLVERFFHDMEAAIPGKLPEHARDLFEKLRWTNAHQLPQNES